MAAPAPLWQPSYPPGLSWDQAPRVSTVVAELDEGLARFGERDFLEFSGRTISFARFGAMVELAARGLRAIGVGPGVHVALHLPNTPHYPVAFYAVQRAGGVVAFSSGNHAQGGALAAQLLGVSATIVMPLDAPASKVAATRGYGAEIVSYDRHTMNRGQIAFDLARERGATLVPPYDDPDVIAGQGTVALELLQETPELDVLVVCTGGGGLLAGCAIAAAELRPEIAIYGVEPEAGDDFARSFALRGSNTARSTGAAGERVSSSAAATSILRSTLRLYLRDNDSNYSSRQD